MNAAGLPLRRLLIVVPRRWAVPHACLLHTSAAPTGNMRHPPRTTLVGVSSLVRPRFFSRHVVLCDDSSKQKTFSEKLGEWRHDFGTVGIVVGGALAILAVVLFIDVVIPTIIRVVPLAVVGFFGAILVGISTVFNYIMRGGKRKEPKESAEKGNPASPKAPPTISSAAPAAQAAPTVRKDGIDEKPRSMTQHTLDPEDNKKAPSPPDVGAIPKGPANEDAASAPTPITPASTHAPASAQEGKDKGTAP